jgi:hypothetical protein
VTLHLLSQACMFIYSSPGKWVFSPLLWSFLPCTTLTRFPAPGCWALAAAAPTFSSQSRLVYLQFYEGFPSPALWRSGCPNLFAMCLYCSYCLLLSFSFFSLGGGSVCAGDMPIWPWVVCGSTAYHLAHLVVLVFPCRLTTGIWRPRGPPGFSVQGEVEMLCAGWRCGGVKGFPLLGGFACKVCLQRFSKISL